MSIATALQNAQAKVAAAYSKCNDKGATMPVTQDLDHLDDCIDSIPTGGGGPISDDADILFIDIDGQNLYGYTRAQALELTELPPLPTREGLICEGWNWTLQEIKDQCNAHMKATIGPMYHTTSGKEELVYMNYCEFIVKGAAATIDWGDGSAVQNAAVDETVTHTTTKNGKIRASIDFASADGYINKVSTSVSADDAHFILEYYCSGNFKSPVNALGACKIMSISGNNVATWSSGQMTMRNLRLLALVVPRGTGDTNIPFGQVENWIEKISMAGNRFVRQVPYMNRNLSRLDIPVNANATVMGETFYVSACIQTFDIPAGFTLILAVIFRDVNHSPKNIIFRATTPPELRNGSSLWAYSRIFVPYSADHSILNEYKTATNWVNYASQIYELTADGDIPATIS